MYLGVTSAVGLYTMPFMANVRPSRRKTSLTQLIANSALILLLTSALPLLSRILGKIFVHFKQNLSLERFQYFLGITNFDLLGDFGKIEWLGNFLIVLLYNFIFMIASGLCLINKFTATVRRELLARLVENYIMFTNYMSFINWFAKANFNTNSPWSSRINLISKDFWRRYLADHWESPKYNVRHLSSTTLQKTYNCSK